MAIIINPDDTLETALAKINNGIKERRTYGIRREELPATKKVTRCIWSNAGARWYCGPPHTRMVCPGASEELKRGLAEVHAKQDQCWSPRTQEEAKEWREKLGELGEKFRKEKPKCRNIVSKVQCLDANEIVIVGLNREKVRELETIFDELPLYAGSFEARGRGVFSLAGIEIPPGIAKRRLDDLDAETIRALVEKTREVTEE